LNSACRPIAIPTLRDCQITTMPAMRMMASPIVTIAATKVGRPNKRRIKEK
jgi:hypothetical protein